MDDVARIFSLSLAMLVGCYVSGSIPLVFTLSEKRLKMVTILGAGLLVGTALAVIIPEGVHALYDQQIHAHQHGHNSRHLHHFVEKPAVSGGSPKDVETTKQHSTFRDHMPKVDTDVFIGLSLCCGFVFMLLIDQLSGGHSHGGPGNTDLENASRQRHKKSTATIGLVVHAAADGIALGAAVSTSKTEVEMIVFIAIMLHKAPAAFGLTTFLLHEGFDRNRIRKHLLAFATAAPLLALLTFFGLSQSSKEVLSSVNGTGIAMLFSAGTFLYVATVHVLPEVEHWSSNTTDTNEGRTDNGKLQRTDLLLLICGILAPLLISQTHSH